VRHWRDPLSAVDGPEANCKLVSIFIRQTLTNRRWDSTDGTEVLDPAGCSPFVSLVWELDCFWVDVMIVLYHEAGERLVSFSKGSLCDFSIITHMLM
jgi:hypothetical protein